MKKAIHALLKDRNRQKEVVRRISQDLGLFIIPKFQQTQARTSRDVVKKVQENGVRAIKISKTLFII